MSTSIAVMGNLAAEYQAFLNSLNNAKVSLAAVQAAGTILYNDTNMASAFPTNWAAFQTFLLAANTSINTFVNGFPAMPSLNS